MQFKGPGEVKIAWVDSKNHIYFREGYRLRLK